IKADVTCPDCFAGYRRIELISRRGQAGQFNCLVCGRVLENFNGSTEIAYRIKTWRPTPASQLRQLGCGGVSNSCIQLMMVQKILELVPKFANPGGRKT